MSNVTIVCKEAIEWVKNNLNPHQKLVITIDGLKIVSEDYVESFNEPTPTKHPLIGKKIFVVNEGGKYTAYQEFYDYMKRRHQSLPPYAQRKSMENRIFEVVDVHKHFRYDDNILVLVSEGYTYLLTDDPKYYKEVL